MERFLTKKKDTQNVKKNSNTNASTKEVTVGDQQHQDPEASVRNTRGNVDNLKALLHTAKLSDINGEVQQLEFSSPLLSGDYRLIEVDPQLADQIQSGMSVVLRGDLDDQPVLCTKDKTYRVKEAETSNSLLVLPKLNFAEDAPKGDLMITTQQVIAMQSRYLELREANVVSLGRLKELLREHELHWDEEDETQQQGKMYTMDDLLDVVQMSEVQLRKALEHLPVIDYQGHLRMLSTTYRDRLLAELTDCCDDEDEPDIQVDSVREPDLFESITRRNEMKTIPREAVIWLLKSHCSKVNEGTGDDAVYSLDERSVCKSKISQLLRAAVCFEYKTFEKLIAQMLPDGIEMKEEYLNGLALVEESLTKGKTIRYMNVEDMPEEEIKRLELLFSLRPKWKLNELQHFLSDLCPTNRSLNEMLAKHCRHSAGEGERYILGLK